MAKEPDTVDRIESSANITLVVGDTEVPISSLDRTKDVEITQVRQNSLKANGYSITSIEYSGSATFKGYRISGPDGRDRLDDLIYDEEGVPCPVTIVIEHELGGETDVFEDVLFVSDSYEVSTDEETETAFDWIAMRKGDE